MYEILVKAGVFVAIILLGIILRRIGFFKEEDFHVLSKVMINVTLTASIITSLSGQEVDYSMLIMVFFGFGFNAGMLFLGYILNRRNGTERQVFEMLNLSGHNIGCMALPFARNFLGPAGVMAVCLFDTGNALICLGGSYAAAETVRNKGQGFSVTFILKKLMSSPAPLTYITMFILCMLHFRFPDPILRFTGTLANANAFLAMLTVGISFKMGGGSSLAYVFRLLGFRFAIALCAAVLGWLFLPLSLECRQAFVICMLAPIAAAAVIYTSMTDGDYGLSGVMNSLSIIISIALITGSLFIIL